MVHCYMCDKDVDKFKTNSHIISKELFKNVKEHGKMISIDNVSGRNEYSTKEIVGDFICEDCEEKTRYDDSFAKEFFIGKKYLNKITSEITLNGKTYDVTKINTCPSYHSIEIYDPRCFVKFKKFVISILLRHSSYLKVIKENDIIPEHHLKELAKIYHNSDLEEFIEKYPVFFTKDYEIKKSISFPIRVRLSGIVSIEFHILGYRINIFVDKRHLIDNSIKMLYCTNKIFRCFVFKGETLLIKEWLNIIRNNKIIGKLKQYKNLTL